MLERKSIARGFGNAILELSEAIETLKSNLIEMLEETFETPRGIYLDRPKGGLLTTLEAVNAETASRESGERRSIAAHVAHLRVYVTALHGYMNGATGKTDWDASWATHAVTGLEWSGLLEGLKLDYESLMRDLREIPDGDIRFAEAMAILAHTAYHFGAIRQLLLHDSNA
jgi:hypothetical protein